MDGPFAKNNTKLAQKAECDLQRTTLNFRGFFMCNKFFVPQSKDFRRLVVGVGSFSHRYGNLAAAHKAAGSHFTLVK